MKVTKAEYYRNWYKKNKTRIRKYKREMMRKLRAKNPEHYRAQSRAAKKRLKDKVFDIYGSVCACGFSDIRALTLDHKNNNGAEERKKIGERGVYLRALRKEYRNEYQVLCMNCQFIKRVEAGRQNQFQQWLNSHGKH
jgi:hypothetical protein